MLVFSSADWTAVVVFRHRHRTALYRCRALYDADQLPEAKRTLAKALHLAPTDPQLRFDVAYTLQVV